MSKKTNMMSIMLAGLVVFSIVVTGTLPVRAEDEHTTEDISKYIKDYTVYTNTTVLDMTTSPVQPVLGKEISIPKGTAHIDGKTEFQWEIGRAVVFGSDTINASVKTLWNRNTLYLYVDITDATNSKDDRVDILADVNNKETTIMNENNGKMTVAVGNYVKTSDVDENSGEIALMDENSGETILHEADNSKFTFYRDGRACENINYIIVEKEQGYSIEAAVVIQKNVILGDQIGFDVRITDESSGTSLSWSDPNNAQDQNTLGLGIATFEKEYKAVYALYATPTVDGEKDAIWDTAIEITTNTWVQGVIGSVAKVRTLWDENNLYIYARITDRLLTKAGANAWEQDSVEVFIDQNNGKTMEYETDDAHYRVNFENTQSFGTGALEEKIKSGVKTFDGGYVVEAAIALDAVTPVVGSFIGFDLQVNNDENGDGTRDSVVTWNDSSGQSHRNTGKLGILRFAKAESLIFTDIYDIAWAKDQIEFLGSKEIVRSITGKNYYPMQEITRADFLLYLMNTLGLSAEADSNFDDVPQDAYYAKAIAMAKTLEITTGVGNNQFKPMDGITRQDMMTLVVRALDIAGRGYEPAGKEDIQSFTDVSLVSDYAVTSVAVLVKRGFIQGAANRLNPRYNLTRAEAAVLLHRIYTE